MHALTEVEPVPVVYWQVGQAVSAQTLPPAAYRPLAARTQPAEDAYEPAAQLTLTHPLAEVVASPAVVNPHAHAVGSELHCAPVVAADQYPLAAAVQVQVVGAVTV